MTSRPSNKEEDDTTSQEGIKPEVDNNSPLVLTTPPSPNPSILLNHYLKENLNPGLTMTPLTPLMVPITLKTTSVTTSWTQTNKEVSYQELVARSLVATPIPPRNQIPQTISQTTLPTPHFKENLDPGLVPIPPTPLIETQTYSSTSHFTSDNKEIPHQGSVAKPPVITVIPPKAPTTELKSRGTLKRMKNGSNIKSNPGQIRLFKRGWKRGESRSRLRLRNKNWNNLTRPRTEKTKQATTMTQDTKFVLSTSSGQT
jgi:hypothetical protein